MPHSPILLTKSRFISGRQCPLKLWNDCHARDLAAPYSDSDLARFDVGHRVEELARFRYPGGVLVEARAWEQAEAVSETRRLMHDPGIPAIFQAGFTHDGAATRVDILQRVDESTWDLIEVKSSTRVKEAQLEDITFQLWVLTGCGVNIRRVGVLTLDRAYRHVEGPYDVERLFTLHQVAGEARSNLELIPDEVERLQLVQSSDSAPVVPPGAQCTTPYECPYRASCSAGVALPEHPIGDLPRLSAQMRTRLLAAGVTDLRDAEGVVNLTAAQARVVQAARTGREFVSGGLLHALDAVTYPVHHIDFETFMPALPLYSGDRPYETIPFQWSNHVERSPDVVDHEDYLHEEASDPRRCFAETLLSSLGNDGTIFVYSGYERRVLDELATRFPDFSSQLHRAMARFVDLCGILRDHYYHPEFHGSFSLKQVLPVLCPGLTYEGLEIRDGGAAAVAFERALACDDVPRKTRIFDALRKYCRLDTSAMVSLIRALRERCNKGTSRVSGRESVRYGAASR